MRRRRRWIGTTLVAAALALVPAALLALHHHRGYGGPLGQRTWLGLDATPLPFDSEEQVLEFLRTAEIVSTERIPVGVTRPRRAVLEEREIRAQATLKTIDVTEDWVRLSDGSHAIELRDYFMFERAAYEVSRLLGIDSVPPTVIRRVGGEQASLQMWIENGMTEAERRERELQPPSAVRWMRQVQTMYLFDDLIGNVDRNVGDIVIDADWKLWMIDHSRAFQVRFEPRHLEQILFCRADVWDRLRALDEEQIRARLGYQLSGPRIEQMLERRDALVARLQGLIDDRGAGSVLYDPGPSPWP